MRLELLSPPVLIGVARREVVLPALLLGRRGERRYVQISRGAGRNHLCWVDAAAVRPAGTQKDVGDSRSAPSAGLPWIRARSNR